jgi:hypothetical protein
MVVWDTEARKTPPMTPLSEFKLFLSIPGEMHRLRAAEKPIQVPGEAPVGLPTPICRRPSFQPAWT